MKSSVKKFVIALAAILLGIGSYYFITGWYNIIPWAIAALIIGYTSDTRRNSFIYGALFGYFLFLTYIFVGYKGKTDTGSVFHFILFDVLFSLAGAIAGMAGALFGNWCRTKFAR